MRVRYRHCTTWKNKNSSQSAKANTPRQEERARTHPAHFALIAVDPTRLDSRYGTDRPLLRVDARRATPWTRRHVAVLEVGGRRGREDGRLLCAEEEAFAEGGLDGEDETGLADARDEEDRGHEGRAGGWVREAEEEEGGDEGLRNQKRASVKKASKSKREKGELT